MIAFSCNIMHGRTSALLTCEAILQRLRPAVIPQAVEGAKFVGVAVGSWRREVAATPRRGCITSGNDVKAQHQQSAIWSVRSCSVCLPSASRLARMRPGLQAVSREGCAWTPRWPPGLSFIATLPRRRQGVQQDSRKDRAGVRLCQVISAPTHARSLPIHAAGAAVQSTTHISAIAAITAVTHKLCTCAWLVGHACNLELPRPAHKASARLRNSKARVRAGFETSRIRCKRKRIAWVCSVLATLHSRKNPGS